jgi:hypothetical protein
VPNLSKKVPAEVAKVLGCAFLFCVFDTIGEAAFPSRRKEQLLEAYFDLGARNQLKEGMNLIRRKPLVVTGHDLEVVMGLIDVEDTQQDAHRSLSLRQQQVPLRSLPKL